MKITLFLATILLVISCTTSAEKLESSDQTEIYSADLKELSDEEYPDNPDITVRHPKYVDAKMDRVEFEKNEEVYTLTVYPTNSSDDTVMLKNIDLWEYIPSVPNCAKDDEYMSLISVVNQEWNRNQVKWSGDDLDLILGYEAIVEGEKITRIDLARNCLNSYLWELFFYSKIDGKDKVFYHGWFDFPKELYKNMFAERNDLSFDKYSEYLENWKDPENAKLNIESIRKVESSEEVTFLDRCDEMYPLQGERKKKEIAIIYPEKYTKMSDFHTDSSLFATFSEPGFYNRKDPRHTELGRFQSLASVSHRKTNSGSESNLDELSLTFKRTNGEITEFVFGGLNFRTLPQLRVEDANSGNQYSMGIGNHPFYEDCGSHCALSSKENPYFGVLLDADGNWLDSHTVGIDGPLLHLDEDNPNILHVWLLSFERHALVGHYEINLID